jgi:hypothetical protein
MNSDRNDGLQIVVHGHISASPESVARQFNALSSAEIHPEADAIIFAINPAAGIDPETIELWHHYNDFQTPRLVAVTASLNSELDFDDAVLLANRVFDPLVTPFLVLHGVDGSPVGLIELLTLKTYDYSKHPVATSDADSELAELVNEFREEYLEQIAESGDGAFAAGIEFPAIPLYLEKNLGIDIINSYLEQLPSRS